MNELRVLNDPAAILAADDATYDTVAVPEWKCSVRLKSLSGTELDAFMDDATRKVPGKNGVVRREVVDKGFKARLVLHTAVDEQGQRLFSDEMYPKLAAKNAAVLNRLFETASRLSGLSDTEVERLGNDSSETDGAASPSVSPLP